MLTYIQPLRRKICSGRKHFFCSLFKLLKVRCRTSFFKNTVITLSRVFIPGSSFDVKVAEAVAEETGLPFVTAENKFEALVMRS